MSKSLYIFGALLILGFGILGAIELMNASTPYVQSVAYVKSAGDRPVQFMGSIVKGTINYDGKADELTFTLADDKGTHLSVVYDGVKPTNFEDADKAVVRGIYRGGKFLADQVSVKCPSKYEGK